MPAGEPTYSKRIVDYVLSCRVMGRRVEETMLCAAVSRARTARGSQRAAGSKLPSRSSYTRSGHSRCISRPPASRTGAAVHDGVMADSDSRTGERYATGPILDWCVDVHAAHDDALARAFATPVSPDRA